MTLSFYIARRFLVMFLTVFIGFFLLLFLIEMVEQIRRFAGTGLGLTATAELALLNVPQSVYRILPMITILSSIAFFLALARSSELVVIRAAGRSALRMLVSPLLMALVIGAFAVAVLNPIVAGTAKRYDTLSNEYRAGEANVVSVSREGMWLRQGGPDGQTVIRAARANYDGTTLYDATFISFDADGLPQSRLDASEARLEAGGWVLSDAKAWEFAQGQNPEQRAQTLAEHRLPSDLTADQIRDSFGTPATIPVWDLPSFISRLERAGFSARKHTVWFQMELALPLLLMSMVLVGAGFTMRHARSGQTGTMVLLAIVSGFAIFLLRNFAQVLGENGQIPVILAAWIPPVAAAMLSLSLVLHLEDG
ncbi:Lipopolysaccharide export system permease protein LptG [Defluviimonas aquaemixtae]|uniref:Lipopolysaccharide export system permease protein LptG n=1 Tax=Albidovulum aquaemixtae TaxID=1542388 RepID=A0A2R8B605_9RHOB|nr:LPS export ABC transporter permease LptG [Defluviimonas aquaemixtae]SPH18055.1 Lipopolysaccharide export system permease protein LptG [Defluviimonas aquaemixtae]